MQEEEPNEARDDTAGEGQGLSEEDESRNNINKSVDGGCGGGHDTPTTQDEVHKTQSEPEKQPRHQHKQQQQQVLLLQPLQPPPPSPLILWERFLPVGSLKVLLVENDDSTRQVVSALLRNCSYEVTAVSNGLEAWKVLKDPTNHIDIVLTEVVMPGFSGIALLSKIMNHRARKNIPVIMMSSHDSMGIVFKCLSKGAVDFLVKPIRKNELKNLWQHVWRRCHSSSGSGSESGIQTQKSVKPKDDDSDNNTGSNSEDDTASIGPNMGDVSDNGSGTQSSWTKHVAEPEGHQPVSPWNQLTEAPDSTCAQVIHPKPEIFSNDWVPRSCSEHKEKSEQLEDNCLEKDLDRSNQRDLEVQLESYPSELVSTKQLSSKFEITKKNSHQSDVMSGELGDNNATCRLTPQAVDLISSVVKDSIIIASAQASNSVNKIIEDKAIDDVKEPPSFDLSLKRLRSIGSGGITSNDDRYVLRRSDHSAFSRYGTSAPSGQKPLHGGSSVLFDSTSDVMKMDSINNTKSKQNISQIPDGSLNINGMGSTTNNNLKKPAAANENLSSLSTIKVSSAFHPMKQQGTESQPVIPDNIDDMPATKAMKEPRLGHQVQVQHHHHHYHHHHHHVHVGQQQVQLPADHGELTLENMATAAPPCGSSNIFSGHIEAAVGTYSINGSASGSNHGSNGQNGSSIMKSGGTNMDAENGLCEKNEAVGCNGSGSGSGSGTDHNRSALRVAALTKFRQKRKQRCFQKRVRYHNRKKLAEQRPRVRGQFVRQIIRDHTSHEADY